MPNIASAAKRHRQSLKRRSKNRAVKSELKTEIRQVREASAAGKIEQAEADFRLAVSKIDRAAGKPLPSVAAELGAGSAAQLFLKWVLGDQAVTVILTGTRNAVHARENLEAVSGRVPDAAQRKAISDWFARL